MISELSAVKYKHMMLPIKIVCAISWQPPSSTDTC